MRYRLIDIETSPITLRMFPETVNGHVSYGHWQRLEPGKVYETEDPAQIQYLREYTVKVRYNTEIEQSLKSAGVPYEVIRCRSCGGRIRKIEYSNIEVME